MRRLHSGVRNRTKLDQVNDHRETFVSGKTEVRVVPKPWGHETIWANTDLYVGKVLHIKAGQSLSLQYHNLKDETIHLLSGTIHQMEGVTDCVLLEASTPHLDDVVRLTDRYDREGTNAP